ncbi:adenine-specific DNA-methyltransferase [Marinobacter nauticus]|uniref:site-specific DNA-methyltransferase (adenine-specific) n=1 Tax=Marinobacter nauticus TaxID=2743 RepID=A0A368X803_MARNT|nr:site-specific DNA-methyltransferase [Marinobacter nauticus]RCW64093.1 adenine-specific DNA-methyltransferase [Marinobacter nauticus]
MQNLFEDLENLLQQDQSFISDGAILKNAVIEAALNLDPALLKILLQSEKIKDHFFTDVSGTMVFDKVKFQEFVSNKAFLPDSYTAFKNRIGLMDGNGSYLGQSRDVSLVWPYKDCVLEGGMTKEDHGRSEIFWNTTLAPDDITRFFEPKVMTNWQRWDQGAVEADQPTAAGEIKSDDNLLIKGNNLVALHSLKERYAGRIKLIYIDPPYNTGNDGFSYNDRFNHSAWLTFMRNRLEVAKSLLRRDGAIFVTLDDTEVHYAKVLMDEIFGREKFVAHIAWQKRTSPDDRVILGNAHDNILVYAREQGTTKRANGTFKTIFEESANRLPMTDKQRAEYKNPDNDPKGPWVHRDFTAQNQKKNGKWGREKQMYWITSPSGNKFYPPEGYCWKVTEEEYRTLEAENRLWFGKDGNNQPRRKKYLSEENGIQSSTWWPHQDAGTNEQAKKELKVLIGTSEASEFTPKPERLISRIIQIATNPGDIVLDFYAGSGTTPAVAQKMNRQWIAVEQMDYIETLTKTRLKKVIDGEQGGVSKPLEWSGGGSFVYAELAASNSMFLDQIQSSQDMTALKQIYQEIQATGFLRYDIDLSSFDIDVFESLPLDDAKRVLMDCLDMNHLYINLSSLKDADFDISADDVAATRSFYGVTP